MKLLLNIFIIAGLILLIEHFMPGIHVAGFMTALIVAAMISVLTFFIRPFLKWLLFLFPIHLLNFKLFGIFVLIVIAVVLISTDAGILLICSKFNRGLVVDSFWSAFFFSIFLYISEFIADVVLAFLRSAAYVIFRLDRFKE